MKNNYLVLMLFCSVFLWQQSYAQERTITGKVTEAENNSPIVGANVLVTGTSKGTITDVNGQFSLELTGDENSLTISFIGYNAMEVEIGTRNYLEVTLTTDAQQLNEVVVVGYGSQKKANLTGAVSTVNTEVLESRPITDLARGLQGAAPGLTITTPSGDLGVEPNIRLRGITGTLSNSSGAKPLILVDNVEIPSLQLINPDDIESISVLKDAASASIYGSRGAWGVILITTKSGRKSEQPRITYSNNFSWATPTETPEIAPAADGGEMALQALRRRVPSLPSFGVVGMYFDDVAIDKMREWEENYGGQDLGPEMVLNRDFEIRDGRLFFYRSWNPGEMYLKDWTPQKKHNISVSGGSEKTNYHLGLGYLNQGGVLKVNPDEFKRYNMSLSLSTDVTDWLEARGNLIFAKTNKTRPYYFSSDTYDPWYYLYRWPANFPYGTYQGHPFRTAITEVQQAKMNDNNDRLTRINIGGTLKPLEGLTIDLDYTNTSNHTTEHRTGGSVSAYNFWATGANLQYAPYTAATHNRVQYYNWWNNRNTGRAFATYSKQINDHTFKIIAGTDIETYESWYQYSEKRDLMDPDKGEFNLATGDQYAAGAHNKWANLGFFGRLNYNFQEKLLLEFNGRYDGSSRLSPSKKWGFFPSMSAGYVLSKENFMDFSEPILSFLKIRGSWGAIGNENAVMSNIYKIMSSYNSNWLLNGQNRLTVGTPGFISEALTWETVTTLDFGLDARFFNNNLGLTFDWYTRTTTDMHSPGLTLPNSFGTGAPLRNFGELQTRGWELTIDWNHSFDNGINFYVTGMLSDFQEKITKFENTTMNIYSNYEGKVLGEIWGYETDRYFTNDDFVQDSNGELITEDGKYVMNDGVPDQSIYENSWFFYGPGDIKYKDLNGDGVIDYGANTVDDHGDLKIIGNSTPRYQYGLQLGADWKGFDLSIFIQGVGKRDYWANGPLFIPGYRGGEGWFTHQLDYWTPENTDAYYPRPTDQQGLADANNSKNFLRQTKYLLDMSYLRMKNVSVGYTLPSSLTSKVNMNELRIYVSGENLFEFDNLQLPIDPEVDYTPAGLNDSNTFGRVYPYRRTLSFGVQATF